MKLFIFSNSRENKHETMTTKKIIQGKKKNFEPKDDIQSIRNFIKHMAQNNKKYIQYFYEIIKGNMIMVAFKFQPTL